MKLYITERSILYGQIVDNFQAHACPGMEFDPLLDIGFIYTYLYWQIQVYFQISESFPIPMPVKFQVITYNIGNGRADPAKLAGMLMGSGADIVVLQEVSQSQGDALEKRLQGIFPYRSIYPGGFAGKAILSRFPIKKAVQIQLIMERPDLMAVVDIQGARVTVIAAHPPPPRFHRTGFHFNEKTRGQISALDDLGKDNAPAVLAGDFNLVSSQNEYRSITRKGLQDAFLESGTGFGYTLPRRVGPWRSMQWLNRLISWVPLIPLARVDYIWTTPSIKSNRCWVGRDAGSDHLPVLAKLEIN